MYPDIKFPMSKVDWLITEFAQKDKPTTADLMRLRTMGGLYDRLDTYRVRAKSMTTEQLESEKHNSSRMGRHLVRAGESRPSSRCDAHAIISGGHAMSIEMRGIMAWLKVRIDDPHNGCWLPRDWGDRLHMPNSLRKAVPHRRIHHEKYYFWMQSRVSYNLIKTPERLINALRLIRCALQSGAVPPEVMPKTGR